MSAIDHKKAKAQALAFIEAERICDGLVIDGFKGEAILARAYLELERQRDELVELVEKAYDNGYDDRNNNLGLEVGMWPATYNSSETKQQLARIMGAEDAS